MTSLGSRYFLIVSQLKSCADTCVLNVNHYSCILFSWIIIGSTAIILWYYAFFRGWVYNKSTWNDSNNRCYIIYYINSISPRYHPQLSGVGNIAVTASHAILFSGGDLIPLWSGFEVISLLIAKYIFPTVLCQRGFTSSWSTTTSMVSSLSSLTPCTTIGKFHLYCIHHGLNLLQHMLLGGVGFSDSISNLSVGVLKHMTIQ